MRFRHSIRGRFLAALFLILLIGQSVGAVILILYTRTALSESLENRMRKAATFVAGVSSGPLLSHEYAMIDAYLDEVMKDDDILSVRVIDPAGKVVRERTRNAEVTLSSFNPFLFSSAMAVKTPVVSEGSKLGDVAVDYSAQTVNGSISRSVVTISLYQLFMLVTVGIVTVGLFNRNVKKPVSEIERTIARITEGDLSAEVPDLGDNEIGSIAGGISFLTEQLSGTVAKLNGTAANVGMAIKQVDMTYKNVIEGTSRQSRAVKDVMKFLQSANRSQSEISDATENLANLSTENVSSLIELKATADEIASNVQRLFKATEDSYSVVAEMAHTAKAVSKNCAEALTAVEDTSASVEEIGASVREVEEHARESSQMAEGVKEITSERGMLAIVNAVEGMDNISSEVKKSAEIVERLGMRSSDIEKVLSVIKDVTEQTNLLSLNAAILAAQAGEHGKSFSVVADEIRALSERTASSTREIGVIVKTIQRDIRDAVESIESATVKVDDGNTLVVRVGEALKDILTASEHSSEMTKSIERATEEQSLGLRQITAAIDDIRKMMNNIAKSTSEEDRALSYLLEGVGEVKEVADLSKRGTEEQAVGTRGISKNLELANDRISRINQTALDQKKLNGDIVAAVEQISAIGTTTVKDMEEVSASLNTLAGEIEILKKGMEVFKIA